MKLDSLTNYYELSASIAFTDPIPLDFESIQVNSVLCVVSENKILVFDQTFNTNTIIIPKIDDADYSEVKVLGMSYEVSKDTHNIEIHLKFNQEVFASDIYIKLQDINGDLTYNAFVENDEEFALDHTITLPNCDMKLQFGNLFVYVGGKCVFNNTIMVNSIVNDDEHRRTNMSNLHWHKLIDQIIKDQDNE